jgi:hypothetical protein
LPQALEASIGFFRSSPLGTVPKSDNSSRLIQDFSFANAQHPSVNSSIDSNDFPCKWGSFAEMADLVIAAPPGSLGATLDVDSAFRRCPVRPDQQHHFVVQWKGQCYVDHCVAFGGASSGGIFGRVVDAFIAICRRRGFAPCLKWVDDFIFINYPSPSSTFPYGLADILDLGTHLGWPWKDEKTHPFASIFAYLGFQWSLADHTVEIPLKKKEKYLTRLLPWTPGTRFSQLEAEQMQGTLAHCALALPDGRSHLVALTRFAASFTKAHSRFSKWEPSLSVISDISFWQDALSRPFCGSLLRLPPPSSSREFWVDASSGWGVGVVVDGKWDAWRLREGWRANGREIGWAEMLAIELGLRLAIERGMQDKHFIVCSDNMGVIGSLQCGCARNLEQNKVLQRIVILMRAHGIWITSCYVASAFNIADRPSRGLPAIHRSCSTTIVPLPPCIADYIELGNVSSIH